MRFHLGKMQGTTVMHYNLNGEELEEYTLLAKTFQTRAGRRFLLRVPQFLKPPLPIVKTGYETKFNILKESNTTSDSHACSPAPTVIGDKSSFTDQVNKLNLTLLKQKEPLRSPCMRCFNSQMQDITGRDNNFNGEKLEEYFPMTKILGPAASKTASGYAPNKWDPQGYSKIGHS